MKNANNIYKLTSNYMIYLSSDNTVYCAKCRLTGKFIKRAIAQAEYEIEYVYKYSVATIIALFISWLCSYIALSNNSSNTLKTLDMSIDKGAISANLDSLMQQAYIDQDYMLFSELNRKRFELLYC